MSATARFTSWREGFRKVPFAKLLTRYMPFSMARRATDDLLDERPVDVRVDSPVAAWQLLRQGEELGAIGEVWDSATNQHRQPQLVP